MLHNILFYSVSLSTFVPCCCPFFASTPHVHGLAYTTYAVRIYILRYTHTKKHEITSYFAANDESLRAEKKKHTHAMTPFFEVFKWI